MAIFVDNLGLSGACLAGLEGAKGAILSEGTPFAASEADAASDAGDRFISAGQRLPSLDFPFPREERVRERVASFSPKPLAVSLRDYQDDFASEMLDRHRKGQDRGLLVLPTGAGKTISVVETLRRLALEWNDAKSYDRFRSSAEDWIPANWRLISDFNRKLRRPEGILFVAHRDFLLRQAKEVLSEVFGADAIGLVQGNTLEWEKPVVVASAQTLIGVLDQIKREKFGLLVLDEAHHYVPENIWAGVLKHLGFLDEEGNIQGNWPRLFVGITATPDRLTGSPLLNVYGSEGLVNALDAADLWDRPDKVILKPEVIEVFLSQPVNTIDGENLGKLLAEFFRIKLNRNNAFHHTLVYVNNVGQVPGVVEVLNGLDIAAEGLTGKTSKENRPEILERFAAGITRVLVNVGVAGEGFDVPSVETIVLAFESESRTRTVHAIGRAMRVDPSRPEKEALVVDLGGNTRRHRLSIQIREAYEAEGGRLIGKRTKQEARGARHENGNKKQETEIEEIGELEFRGEKPVTKFIEEVFTILKISAGEIQKAAYRLGVPSDILFAYANGLRVPASLTEVINISRELGDQGGLLHDAWAKEKTAQMEIIQPLQANMGEKMKEWVRYLRYCLWHRYEGVVGRVFGISSDAVQRWIQEGKVEGKNAIWEESVQRVFIGFEIPGKRNEFLEKLNAYLEEKKFPLFEEWMFGAEIDSILIYRLLQLAKKLGHSPTVFELHDEPGMASRGPYDARFGTWKRALAMASLKTNTREELVADLQLLAEQLGRPPRRRELGAASGTTSSGCYEIFFGSFNLALKAAGLVIHRKGSKKSRWDHAAELQSLMNRLGRIPTPEEVNAEPGLGSVEGYVNIFGTWDDALAAAAKMKSGERVKATKSNRKKNRRDHLKDLRGLIKQLGRLPTREEVDASRKVASVETLIEVFRTFTQALKEATEETEGIETRKVKEVKEPKPEPKERRQKTRLMKDLKALATQLGRMPTREEVDTTPGMASVEAYADVFGSFTQALYDADSKN